MYLLCYFFNALIIKRICQCANFCNAEMCCHCVIAAREYPKQKGNTPISYRIKEKNSCLYWKKDEGFIFAWCTEIRVIQKGCIAFCSTLQNTQYPWNGFLSGPSNWKLASWDPMFLALKDIPFSASCLSTQDLNNIWHTSRKV